MAYYALLDENNIVTEVITGRDEDEEVNGITDWEEYYGNRHGCVCKRTSYNTEGNQHLYGKTPFRGNFGAVGHVYDEELDVFLPPQPFLSWSLNTDTYQWDPPTPYPDDYDHLYYWDEETLNWIVVEPPALPDNPPPVDAP